MFADEPTGNLDSRSGAEVLTLLRRSVDEFGQTVVMVTHDPVAAAFTDRVLFLADGRVVDELREPDRETVLDRMTRMDARQLDAVAADGTPADPPERPTVRRRPLSSMPRSRRDAMVGVEGAREVPWAT